jgi:hypothetical protein
VKVTTYTEAERFNYRESRDCSGDIIGLDQYNVIKLRFAKQWGCANEQTKATFQAQAASLRDRNRHRDRHMDYADVTTTLTTQILQTNRSIIGC